MSLKNAGTDGSSTKVLLPGKKEKAEPEPKFKNSKETSLCRKAFYFEKHFFKFLKYSVKYNIELCLQVSLCMSCQLFTCRYIQSADNY